MSGLCVFTLIGSFYFFFWCSIQVSLIFLSNVVAPMAAGSFHNKGELELTLRLGRPMTTRTPSWSRAAVSRGKAAGLGPTDASVGWSGQACV